MHRQRERVVSVPQPFQRGREIMAVETSSDKDNGNGSNRYRQRGADFSYFFCVLCSTLSKYAGSYCFGEKARVIELFNITRVQTKELLT